MLLQLHFWQETPRYWRLHGAGHALDLSFATFNRADGVDFRLDDALRRRVVPSSP
jgi:hypothetical protein